MKKTVKKRSFISAIAMLIVSAIVLTSSTFAWFSVSKNAEVSSMNLNITTADGISISANTHKFGTTVTMDDIIPAAANAGKGLAADDDHTNHIPALLAPASTQMYLVDNFPVFYKGSIPDAPAGTLKNVVLEKVEDETDDVLGCFVVFDLFVQVSENKTVKLSGTNIKCDDPNVGTVMRVGLVNCGYEAFENRDAVKTAHEAKAADTAMWIVDGNNDSKYVQYDTGNQSIREHDGIITAYVQNSSANTVCTNSSSKTEKDDKGVEKTVFENTSGFTFDAKAGVNRIRFYIWVEGNDPQCKNDIAGNSFDFNLKLAID